MKIFKNKKGFTLIEILVVIGIIAVLAVIVLVAINPAKQFAQARNTQRTSNVTTILNAIGQRIADNKGLFPGQFSGTTYTCGTLPTTDTNITTSQPALATDVSAGLGCLVPTYLASLPLDPTAATGASDTLYTVKRDSTTGRITVCAPKAALETSIPDAATICLTR